MHKQAPPTARAVFDHALDLHSQDRERYLAAACGGDGELRRKVEALLQAHHDAGSFLEVPAVGAAPGPRAAARSSCPPGPERPGAAVGPYVLLEQIGEGGMGVVFLAEQTRPVRRQVALKVIKAGMDTRQVIARFGAERQALALMDHPNIARVLDGGATDTGRPYFVMELVKGVPVTRYCDEHRLTLRQRLELFVQVCGAVQHAHTKGVIHRDLKPNNVLVTSYDGRPVPKVIDFGVAKATSERLTEQTLFTGFGALVGTPEYMSPEQAELNQLDVDTRSDVYSLGVLLYELLTGTTPLDRGRLKTEPLLEVLRVVREQEPPRPSTRLSAADTIASVAASRGTLPGKLAGIVRGDLDWIVMRAMEKDRDRRYETAIGLARDVERYLNDEPVAACPPSASYRLRKFARRHKSAAGGAGATVLVVLLVVLTLALSNARIRREQRRTEGEKLRTDGALKLAERRGDEIREGLERLKAANALLDRGRWYFGERRWDDANAALTKAIELRPDHVSLWTWRADLYASLGLWDLTATDVAHEIALREPDTALRWFQHVALRRAAGDHEACRRACRRMRELFGGSLNHMFAHELLRAHSLCPGEFADGDAAEAARLMDLAHEIRARHASSSYALFVLGAAHYRAGEYEQAVRRLEEGIGTNDWGVRLLGQPVLAMAWHRLGRPEAARRWLDEAAATRDRWTAARYAGGGGRWDEGKGAEPVWPIAWWDQLEMELWYREAHLTIAAAEPPADSREHVIRARALRDLGWADAAVAEYATALGLSPGDRQVRLETHYAKAYGHIHKREWAEAAAELAAATDIRPDDVHLWRARALAHFVAEDGPGYWASCGEMVRRFGETEDPGTASCVVHACVLRGAADDARGGLLPLAEVAAGQWHYGTWTQAAALYRAGRYDDAARCFETAAKTYRPRALDLYFRAMNCHGLGRPAEARRFLEQAARWVEQADRNEGDDPTRTRPAWGEWHERPVCRLLAKEAGELVNGQAGGQPPAAGATR